MGTQKVGEAPPWALGAEETLTLEPVQKEVRKLPHAGPSRLPLPSKNAHRELMHHMGHQPCVTSARGTGTEITCTGAVIGFVCLRMCSWSLLGKRSAFPKAATGCCSVGVWGFAPSRIVVASLPFFRYSKRPLLGPPGATPLGEAT